MPRGASVASSIPPEVLGLIFEEVHLAHVTDLRTLVSGSGAPQSHCTTRSGITDVLSVHQDIGLAIGDLASEVKRPSFFPYSLASVCSYWEGVLSSQPRFWTTVVIFLNYGWCAIEDWQKYLAWSRELEIDVFMVNEPGRFNSVFSSHSWESHAVPGWMEALMPHFHRCRTLYINTTMNSALPIFPSQIPAEASRLRHIFFTSENGFLCWNKDASKHDFSMKSDHFGGSWVGALSDFKPRLKTLSIDGRNLLTAIAEKKSWITNLDELEELTILSYSPTKISYQNPSIGRPHEFHICDECGLPLYPVLELIESASSLKHLTFRGVMFKSDSGVFNPRDGERYDLSTLETISLTEISSDDVEDILRVCGFSDDADIQSLIFDSCRRLSHIHFPILTMPQLQLYRLDDSVDLECVVKPWQGHTLTIVDCSNFSDSFLEMLSKPVDSDIDGDDDDDYLQFPCHEMEVISLHFPNSTPYSLAAIKTLIESRGRAVDYTDADWRDDIESPALRVLRLSGRVPALSSEQEAWFRSRLVDFCLGAWWEP